MDSLKSLPFVTRGNLYQVPPDRLVEQQGFNIRLDDAEMEAKIETYAALFLAGQRPPPLDVYVRSLKGQEPEVIVIDGHLRRRAALRAIERGCNVRTLDCQEFVGNDADRIARMVRSGQGTSWRPIELARGYLRLYNLGWTIPEICTAAGGRDPSHVNGLLTLATADMAVQQHVMADRISATQAIAIIREHGHGAAAVIEEALARAAEEGRSRATAVHFRAEAAPPPIELAVAPEIHAMLGPDVAVLAPTPAPQPKTVAPIFAPALPTEGPQTGAAGGSPATLPSSPPIETAGNNVVSLHGTARDRAPSSSSTSEPARAAVRMVKELQAHFRRQMEDAGLSTEQLTSLDWSFDLDATLVARLMEISL